MSPQQRVVTTWAERVDAKLTELERPWAWLARQIGIDRGNLHKVKNGVMGYPLRSEYKRVIAAALDCDEADLFEDETPKETGG